MPDISNTPNPKPPHIVDEEYAGQRLDNYLMREWRGAPKSLIYRLIRTGQVRVNSGRASPDQRLAGGDRLRLPPNEPCHNDQPKNAAPITLPILYEDNSLLIVNKPPGLAVHGGSGQAHGVIERLRAAHPEMRFLELVHRLDKETSGVLLLAKKRAALRRIQEQWRQRNVEKKYIALVFGQWRKHHRHINLPLKRITDADGNRRMFVHEDGKESRTTTALLQQWQYAALLEATIKTGRTHQLRVHLADANLPIVGDDKYGRFVNNRTASRGSNSLARMYLHAATLGFVHPDSGEDIRLEAALPAAFARMGERLDTAP